MIRTGECPHSRRTSRRGAGTSWYSDDMGKRVIAGKDDLATTHPGLAAEWHPTKNVDLTPQHVLAGTNRKVWWLCDAGHEWQDTGGNRSNGRACPICSGHQVLVGYNDLATTHPDLAREWHPTKNVDLTPQHVLAGTNRKVWWECDYGHEWQAIGASRVRGAGCPVCAGKVALSGYNDVATTHPELVAEWHPTKNVDLAPWNVVAGSSKRIWWSCPKGHDWETRILNRKRGSGCPVCAGQVVVAGDNDLGTTHPDVATEWHPTKNGDLTPRSVVAGTTRRVWWRCSVGHQWEATVSNRSRNGSGCPVCTGQKVLEGYNDLRTTRPGLAAEWHPTKNGARRTTEVTAGSGTKAWWLCDVGHSWVSTCANRAIGQGCPTCATTGFDPSKPALLYFITHRGFGARKVGITNTGTGRLRSFAKAGWVENFTKEHSDGAVTREVEVAVFDWLRRDLQLAAYLGKEEMRQTGGWTETFSMEGPSDNEIIARIEAEFDRLGDSIL